MHTRRALDALHQLALTSTMLALIALLGATLLTGTTDRPAAAAGQSLARSGVR